MVEKLEDISKQYKKMPKQQKDTEVLTYRNEELHYGKSLSMTTDYECDDGNICSD